MRISRPKLTFRSGFRVVGRPQSRRVRNGRPSLNDNHDHALHGATWERVPPDPQRASSRFDLITGCAPSIGSFWPIKQNRRHKSAGLWNWSNCGSDATELPVLVYPVGVGIIGPADFGSAKLRLICGCSSTQINVEATERISAVPILLWLLGVPLSVVVVLWLVHVI